ncbi:MAG TPA: chlorite dismutase family protein [Acidimicrobiales bacterium]|nr:chlorite dismutase family protein [Acidimicrobiales bacterium]
MSSDTGPQAVGPSVGWNVVHLFCRLGAGAGDRPLSTEVGRPRAAGVLEAVDRARKSDHQVVTVAMIGHKADLCVLGLGPDLGVLRALQTDLRQAGLEVVDSYVSLTEISEYAGGVPEEMRQARLYPVLPPDGMPAFCFYPMSKRRSPGAENWYRLPYDDRLKLMHGHGAVGREFRGRVLQLVTGSTGLDDYEWGVTLFGVHPDDLKDCVYRMRFDEGSAVYAEFGPFYTGIVGDADDVLRRLGVA